MIEKCLIEHCAPTLASLKAANLFNACCEEEENIDLQISMWNQLMNPKGVKLLALRSRGNRSLVYVYREKQLVRVKSHGLLGIGGQRAPAGHG